MKNRRAASVAPVGVLFSLASISSVQASSYTGPVLDLRTITSPQTGNLRVSIQIAGAGTTSCSFPGWYSFDLPSGPVESMWTAILLAAIHDGSNVTIMGGGSNNCDAYGIEEVSYIDALPP
jgi:hypothetical protein